jgi:uncharacterized protein (AIM24 family)
MAAPALLPTNVRDETIAGVTYHIQGELVPVLMVDIPPNNSIYFEHHVLLWKDPKVSVRLRRMKGAMKRMFAGLPILLTGTQGSGHVALSRDGAGQICAIHLKKGQGLHVREHQFLGATANINYSFNLVKGLGNIFFSSSGVFIDYFSAPETPGVVWLHGFGNVFEVNLKAGEQIDVEPSAWVYKDPSVKLEVKIQGLTASLLGMSGTRFIINRFTGPGRLGIQSMSFIPPSAPRR